MSILWTIIIGFVAGVIAKFIMPGENEPTGFVLTAILGIVGAFVATYLDRSSRWSDYCAGSLRLDRRRKSPNDLSCGNGHRRSPHGASMSGFKDSAIRAPHCPREACFPIVATAAVWCSSSALILAPTRMTIVDIQIQVMKPIAAPREPYVLL
jgi:uncharacterized membrane protein YeaQ/YmgE (transglycosylase-associated protein family)